MAPLPPEAFSLGPLAFSMGPLVVALAYSRLLNLPWFFRISVSVEVIVLLSVVAVLIYPQSFLLAAGVYLCFQLTLIFGNYLVRLETLVIAKESFKPVDIGKTLGALAGALFALGFYQWARTWLDTEDSLILIQYLHYPLLVIQLGNLSLLVFSFDRDKFDHPL
jgi:hypothetical protein